MAKARPLPKPPARTGRALLRARDAAPSPSGGAGNARNLLVLFGRMMLGLAGSALGFRELSFVSDREVAEGRKWGAYRNRRLRYSVYWGHYENNVYREVHSWSAAQKAEFGLYASTRSIYSPAYEIVEFWASHVQGGSLDRDAGDGRRVTTALPIQTDNDALRPALAALWRDSNWQTEAEQFGRLGAACGDVGLKCVHDRATRRVYLRVVHPSTVRVYNRNAADECTGYVIEEWRADPDQVGAQGVDPYDLPEATYTEICQMENGRARFQTFKNGEPYDWHDYPDSVPFDERTAYDWTEDYGFVPLRMVQHRNMGLGWGWSELHPTAPRLMELDDQASKLNDQVRKLVDAPWLMVGMDAGDPDVIGSSNFKVTYLDGTDDEPVPGRTSVPMFFATNEAAKATPLVAPLDVSAVSAHVQTLLAAVEKDHPELTADMSTSAGDASGRALRVAREKVEKVVASRRAGYDAALVAVQKMCLAVGAAGDADGPYPGYEGLQGAEYGSPALDHSVGDRQVFAVDETDRLEQEQLRATLVQTLVTAGLPLEAALARAGYADDEVAEVVGLMKKKAEEAAAAFAEQQKAAAAAGTATVPPEPGGKSGYAPDHGKASAPGEGGNAAKPAPGGPAGSAGVGAGSDQYQG